MTRDPFYRQIVARLNGRLDPELFERCASELLRSTYPGLIPVRGGGDMGMDGAIADGDGRAYPLVCTVGEDVSGNLRKSLQSYLHGTGQRRHAVSATSQSLTPARQRNLEAVAEELGFTLVAVHEQAHFANLLYRDPNWCRELLELPHDIPPLSALPRTLRPTPVGELIGRAEDLAWLRNTKSDVLLVGQPGMGKTALLADLARSGDGLFVVTDDTGRIMAGVREHQPPVLLVDDAHLRLDLLAELRRQREEMGLNFRIVADCWPGESDAVARALRATNSSSRRLEPLIRADIVAVIRGQGICGPDALLRELIHQADGRPGLAVTLCDICRREDNIGSVALGDALARDVRATFEQLVGRDAITTLACFALGGDVGMRVTDVSTFLNLSLAQAHAIVTGLAAGGVLVQVAPQVLVVRPEPLRHALVRDVFFNGLVTLPVESLLKCASSPDRATRTLIGARARFGRVPFHLLVDRLSRASDQALLEFAFLDRRECEWVLTNHPDRLRAIAEAALCQMPAEAAALLLSASSQDGGEWAAILLRQWIEAAFPGSQEPVRRRMTVLRAVTQWLDAARDPRPTIAVACVALSPNYGEWIPDPADRFRAVHRFGLITGEEMAEVRALWPGICDRLAAVAGVVVDWQPLQELYRVWSWPGFGRVNVPQEMVASTAEFAAEMLADLARLWRDRLGPLRWAWQMAALRKSELPVTLPADFVTLYPFRQPGDDWSERMACEHAAAQALSARWAIEPPEAVAARLAAWEAEISAPGTHPDHRWSFSVCEAIAARVSDPGAWADVFEANELSGDLLAPFLARSVAIGESGWEEHLLTAIERPVTEGAAIAIILGLPGEVPTRLWAAVWDRLPRFLNLVLVLCGSRMPEARMATLLGHPDPTVAAQAAQGEWHSEPRGSVRPRLALAWRAAMARGAEYVPNEAWEQFPGLEHDWLASLFVRDPHRFRNNLLSDARVFDRLAAPERSSLLDLVPLDSLWVGETVRRLVGSDGVVFVRLLADARLRQVRMAPLWGPPIGAWPALATVALSAGVEPEQVAGAAFTELFAFAGNESNYWVAWRDGFAALTSGTDVRLCEVGEIGFAEAERRIAVARREERHEAVYGGE